MQLIKFHENYSANGVIFVLNGEYEFVDKHEEYHDDWIWVYRVEINGVRYNVDGDCVVEITSNLDKPNKDYTWDQWKTKITHDTMVEEGNYVKAWKNSFGINDPVKEGVEQTDYDSGWKRTQKRIREYYSTTPSERGDSIP